MLQPGDTAPDFTLPDQDGNPVSLSQFRGRKVVLYFYPKDNTPGCTKEACAFRDAMSDLTAKGMVVLGVSTDSPESHRKFIAKHNLNFTLLADTEKEVVQLYEAYGEKSLYGRFFKGTLRKTYLIDEEGKIFKIYPKVKVKGHVEEIIKDWSLA